MRSKPYRKPRLALVDLVRSVALLAMIVYHFGWDLEFFGYAPAGMTAEPQWRYFARAIASTFLFVAGFSLVLAHSGSFKWAAFARRLAQVAGAAAVITLSTWYLFPDTFIFFGILHAIALFSLLGLPFLHTPWWAVLAAAIAVFALPALFRDELFAMPALWFSGLAPFPPRSNDYVPLFPWFSATLAGISAGLFLRHFGLLDRLESIKFNVPDWVLLPGRRSLIVYLVHQPLLLAAVWGWSQISPPMITAERVHPACMRQCTALQNRDYCEAYCRCTLDALEANGILASIMRSQGSADENLLANDIMNQCTNAANDRLKQP